MKDANDELGKCPFFQFYIHDSTWLLCLKIISTALEPLPEDYFLYVFLEAVSLKSSDLVDGVIHQPPGSLKDWKDCFPIRSPGSLQRNKDLPSLKLTNCPWNGWLEDEISCWDGLFSGDMLVSGGGYKIPKKKYTHRWTITTDWKISTFPKTKYTSLNIVYTCFFQIAPWIRENTLEYILTLNFSEKNTPKEKKTSILNPHPPKIPTTVLLPTPNPVAKTQPPMVSIVGLTTSHDFQLPLHSFAALPRCITLLRNLLQLSPRVQDRQVAMVTVPWKLLRLLSKWMVHDSDPWKQTAGYPKWMLWKR